MTHVADSSPTVHPPVAPERPADRAPSDGPRMLPRATVLDTLRVVGTVVVPLLARGVIVRRPSQVRLAERTGADGRAVELLQDLRHRYGRGPLRLRIPGRRMVVVLSPEHVHRVLEESPEPFSPATREKRAALSHFEPHNVLISDPQDRPDRRRFVEDVLDDPHDVHRGAGPMVRAITEEADALLEHVDRTGVLEWDEYARAWLRVVRRVTLGDSAAADHAITDDLVALRGTANWAFMHPKRTALRERFLDQVRAYLDRAEPGSLAYWASRAPVTPDTHPEHQVPQFLFAFDAATWASYRALGLLASHPEQQALAHDEVRGRDLATPQDLPFVRAAVLESLRLWPTTPAVLRQTTRRTRWEDGPMPEGTSVLIYAPFFHRDDENLPAAHRFEPELWADGRTSQDWPLIPFSAGPVICPGRNLVLHTTSTFLGRILDGRRITLDGDRLDPGRAMPPTLDPFTLRFRVEPAEPAEPAVPAVPADPTAATS